jgi:integrase
VASTANEEQPQPEATKKQARRRGSSPHSGVVLIPPDGSHTYWRARFKNPDTGRTVKVKLDPLSVRGAKARTDWAKLKAKALASRRDELLEGAPRATGMMLAVALERYFEAHPTLSERTVKIYRTAANKLLKWGEDNGVLSADDLTRAQLMSFREALIRQPKHAPLQRAKRGVYKATGKRRSASAINQELRSIRTVLGYLRDLDLLVKLSFDDLRRALKRLPASFERIDFLKPHECQQLLEAALKHDAETFAETREEHAGRKQVGSTPRFEAVAPFVALVLLTGMRRSEALELDWTQVDLNALDHDGRAVGEIYLGSDTKTHRARTIDLDVSSVLRSLLAALRLSSGGKGLALNVTEGIVDAAAKRMRTEFGAPSKFTWQMLRATCGTYLTNAPGIFGAASAYRSAKQLGHSVAVAQRHYLGLIRGIPRDARTLEQAMQIEDPVKRIVASVASSRRAGAVGAARRPVRSSTPGN